MFCKILPSTFQKFEKYSDFKDKHCKLGINDINII